MSAVTNKGYDPEVIASYKTRIMKSGYHYIVDEQDENSDEYVHFYFIGLYEGKEVVYDAVLYTLRLQHESEMFEIAEHRAAKHFPNYKKITYEENEFGDLDLLDDEEEEIGLFMAEVIMELEEDESVKVKEHADVDVHTDFGVALDIGLHVEQITPEVIQKFIHEFNEGTLQLDPALYSFQTKGEEA